MEVTIFGSVWNSRGNWEPYLARFGNLEATENYVWLGLEAGGDWELYSAWSKNLEVTENYIRLDLKNWRRLRIIFGSFWNSRGNWELYSARSGNLEFFFFFFLKICSWRFVIWRFVLLKMCSWRFHLDLSFEDLFRRFFLLWRCVHGDLSIEDWSEGDLSLFEDLFMKICHLKIWIGDLSVEDLFMEICHLKICSGKFSFWKFVFRRFFLFENVLGDLSFWNFFGRFVLWKLKFRKFFLF